MANSVNEAGGGTDWSTMSMAQIWSVLAGYDTDPQWTHVSGWRRAYELASAHLQRMREFRAKIAATWPPEKNEAAQAYLARMDEMISSIQTTHDAASSNYTTVATATAAIDSTRIKLLPVYEEWLSNEERLAGYRPAPGGTPVPAPGPPPVAPGRQEELTQQARRLMVELSGTLASASYMMVTPPGYAAPHLKIDHATSVRYSDRSSLSPPAIPPVTPMRLTQVVSSTSFPRQVSPGGPRLGKGQMPAFPTAPNSSLTPTPPNPSSRDRKILGVIGTVPGVLPSGGSQWHRDVNSIPPARDGNLRPRGFTPGPISQPMPPGGVIGPPLGAGLYQTGGNRPVQRINPVGGVFGEQSNGSPPDSAIRPGAQAAAFIASQQTGGAPTSQVSGHQRSYTRAPDSGFTGELKAAAHQAASTGSASRPATAAVGAANGTGSAALGSFRTADGHLVTVAGTEPSRRPHEPRSTGPHLDPNNPWITNKGVPSVVEAPLPPGQHDPGPAVGLSQ